MTSTTVVTARLGNELAERLDRLASSYDRPRAWVIARALERYLDEELELLASIAEAEADIAAGRVFTQEQVEALFNADRAQRDAA